MHVVLLGPPGSGKGAQAKRLASALALTPIASGDLFRENLNRETPLGLRAREFMNRGELVPDDVTVAMVRERIKPISRQWGLLFDGFPRSLPQAEALDAMLAECGRRLDAVFYLDVADDAVVRRLSGRVICRQCQVPFHREMHPFVTCPSGSCHGEHLYQRDDDRPDTVRARLVTYHTVTQPLTDYYRAANLLVRVDGEAPIAQVTDSLLAAVDSRA